MKKINRWLRVCPERLAVCEYPLNSYEPAPVDNIASRRRYYAKRSLRGIVFLYGTPGNFRGLWRYLCAKLMWNPWLDAQKIAENYIKLRYGSVSEPILRLFRLFHKQYETTLKSGVPLDGLYPNGYYSEEFVGEMRECFEEAEKLAKPALRSRIYGEEAMALLDVLEHLPSRTLTERNNNYAISLLERLKELALKTNSKFKFIADTRKWSARIKENYKDYREVIEKWLKESLEELRPPVVKSLQREALQEQ